jgi:hypothetical protein
MTAKAVAGGVITTSRSFDDDDDEVVVKLGKDVPVEFVPFILKVLPTLDPSLAKQVPGSSCFGHMWTDEEGTCPEEECNLRAHCETLYNEVRFPQTVITPKKVAAPPTPVPAPTVGTPAAANRSLAATTPKRGKYKGTGKYERWGYHDLGRPVDQMIRMLVVALGEPKELPKNWSPVHFERGLYKDHRITIARTASYHTFLVDGKTALRFWTNAAGNAIVDLSAAMVIAVKQAGIDVMDISPAMQRKLAPCTGRIYCKDDKEAERLAAFIVDIYSIDNIKKGKNKK